MKNNQYRKALPIYQKITKKYPDNYKGWTNLGIAFSNLNKSKSAFNCFNKALKLNRKIPIAYHQRGLLFVLQKNHKKALKEFDLATKYDPKYWQAWHSKGLTYLTLEMIDASLKSLEKSTKYNPKFATAYFYKGLILAIKSEFKKAIVAAKRSTTLNPKVSKYWSLQGQIYDSMKNCKSAEIAFEKALKLNPNDPEALHHKGMTLGNNGKTKEALPLFVKAVKLSPTPNKFRNLGLALFELKKYSEAIKPIKKHLEFSPKDVNMLTKLGISLEELGRNKEALAYFQQAVKIKTNCETLTNLGISHGKQNDLKKSLECFRRAEKINPKDEIILLNIAITSNLMKNYKTTLDYAERLIDLDQTSLSGWLQKALSLLHMKKTDAALNALSVAISLNPEVKRNIATDPEFKNLRKMDRFKKLTS